MVAFKLLVISPVHNEAGHIEAVVRAVAAQTRPPDEWVVVDDDSTDGTLEKLRALERDISFMRVMQSLSPSDAAVPRDGLACARDAKAFNLGLSSARLEEFSHVGKLDGDVELPPHYFKELLAAFDEDSHLGIACGELVEYRKGHARVVEKAAHHVHGAVKTYSRDCFRDVGGLWEQLGWDTVDETYARMLGYRTGSLSHLEAVHLRPVGSANGMLRGRARHGECAYIVHYSPVWVTLRGLRMCRMSPVVLSGLAFLYGYFRAAVRGTAQIDDAQFRRYARWELRRRIQSAIRLRTHPVRTPDLSLTTQAIGHLPSGH